MTQVCPRNLDARHAAYIYADNQPTVRIDPSGMIDCGRFDPFCPVLKPIIDTLDKGKNKVEQGYENVRTQLHTGIDLFGFVPAFGDAADAINALLYELEGDQTNAAISCLAVVPLFGSFLSQGLKHGDEGVDAFKAAKRRFKQRDESGAIEFPGRRPLSPNQMNQAIARGQAPAGITRVDTPKVPNEKLHVTFEGGAALNVDGTWKHGYVDLTNAQKKWLLANGWTLPK